MQRHWDLAVLLVLEPPLVVDVVALVLGVRLVLQRAEDVDVSQPAAHPLGGVPGALEVALVLLAGAGGSRVGAEALGAVLDAGKVVPGVGAEFHAPKSKISCVQS